jgi:hypothetical protein
VTTGNNTTAVGVVVGMAATVDVAEGVGITGDGSVDRAVAGAVARGVPVAIALKDPGGVGATGADRQLGSMSRSTHATVAAWARALIP